MSIRGRIDKDPSSKSVDEISLKREGSRLDVWYYARALVRIRQAVNSLSVLGELGYKFDDDVLPSSCFATTTSTLRSTLRQSQPSRFRSV